MSFESNGGNFWGGLNPNFSKKPGVDYDPNDSLGMWDWQNTSDEALRNYEHTDTGKLNPELVKRAKAELSAREQRAKYVEQGKRGRAATILTDPAEVGVVPNRSLLT